MKPEYKMIYWVVKFLYSEKKNVFISSFYIVPLVVSGLRELSFPSGYPEKDLQKNK